MLASFWDTSGVVRGQGGGPSGLLSPLSLRQAQVEVGRREEKMGFSSAIEKDFTAEAVLQDTLLRRRERTGSG